MQTVRAAVMAALAGLVLGATPPPLPVRQLVYDFTYTNIATMTEHDSGISAAVGAGNTARAPISGVAESQAADSDLGTISVDVLREQPDTGLIVSISEEAHNRRSSPKATCAVYGNTNVICDPYVHVNTEELALLRLLGSNFVDVDQIDPKNHWRVDQSGRHLSDVADFSIDKNVDGILRISSVRVLREIDAIGFVSTTNGTITYDNARAIPTTIVEDETTRESAGVGAYNTVRTQTSLTLVRDTAAKTP
jgi:hypothetical protein